MANPQQCTQSAQISSKSVHFRRTGGVTAERVNTAKTRRSESNIPLNASFEPNNNKLARYRTDGQLFRTDVSAYFEVTWHKTRPNINNPARSNLDIVP